ncbi:MAG: hypothetical protein H0U84_09475, partial [Thermoleophilaceae bacterium]|nr:hypothetical protein [Thermoleophilaceae bacterium]
MRDIFARSAATPVAGPQERRAPLPSLLLLPLRLWGALGRRGRIVTAALLATAAAGVAVAVPLLDDVRERIAGDDRRQAAVSLAERRRQLAADQRPRTAVLPAAVLR